MHTTSPSCSMPRTTRRLPTRVRRLAPLLLAVTLLAAPLLGAMPAMAATAIASLSPANGPVGSAVTLTGTINTANGAFTVRLDAATGTVLASGTSTASSSVTASFTIPVAVRGAHSIILVDATAGLRKGECGRAPQP